MAPTPDPTVPVLDTTLTSKTIDFAINKLYLGKNIVVSDSTNGFQTTLPVTTTDLMYASAYRVASGSTYDYFKSDNFKIDSSGAITTNGTITSTATGANSLAGSLNVALALTAGSLSTAGALNAGSLNAGSASVTGALSSGSISSGAITSSATMTANNLKITSTNLQIDSTSATNSITLNGALKVNAAATGASVFKLDSTTGEIQTYGNISTTGTGNITAGGSLNASALNIGNGFKVDSYGALVVKDSADNTKTLYSFDKNGNFFTSGSLTAPGTATLAAGKFVVDGTSGNLTAQGITTSGNVAVTGNLKTTGVVNIGTDASPAIQLSNNGTSYFKNSLQIGDATSQKSILHADGTASFATGNFTVAAAGDVVAKGTASFGNNAVALGFAQGAVPANAKVSVDSAGNVAAAGTLAVAGNSTLTGTLSVAGNNLTVNALGNLATKGALSVSDGKLTADANGNVVAAGTLQAATNKFNVNAAGDVSTTGKLAVTGDSTLSGKLDVTGNSTFAGTLSATGAVTAASTLRVTGATTLSNTLAVTGDLAVNTDKFKVTATSGDVSATGNLTVAGNANFSGSQIQLNTDGSVFAKNYVKTDFAVTNYVKSTASDDLTTAIVPTVNSVADQALFNSSTNKYLTTQEYVDRAVFKQAARLNLITKDIDTNLATFNNFSKVLASIEGSSAATIMNGLVDSVDDIKVSVSDLMGGGYNSIVISCVPSVWGDAAAPEPIPTPISDLYKEDGWFYSNLHADSKINWYLPAYSGMKMKDIMNLFMNNFLLSTVKLPKITIYTAPKNDSTDTISGIYNAKIEYNFNAVLPASVTAIRSALYIIDAPKNVYSDKSNDIKSGYSITTRGGTVPVTTPITLSTIFSNSFDTSKVGSEDRILTFAIETNESSIKDYMFILQNFNISTKTGTTQMLFQNVSVVSDYLFKYFFRQHPDFSDASTDKTNVVDKNTYGGYVSNILANSLVNVPASSLVSPQSHNTNFTLTIGGQSVTSDNQTLIFGSSTITNVPIICNLVNKNDSVTIKHGLTTIVNGVAGDYNGTRNLTVGDNNFVVTVKDPANDHSTIINCIVHVKISDPSLKTILVNAITNDRMNQSIQNNSTVNLPAGTANATIYVTTNAALVNSCKVAGGTTASTELVANGVVSSNGVLINGLVTGDNTVTIVTKSEDLSSTVTTTFKVHVLSGDTSLSVFTIEGQNALTATTINLGSSFIGKTISQLSITKTATASTSSAGSVTLHTPTLQVGSNIMEFTVIAENSSVQTYTRTLYVKSSEAGLASVTINNVAKELTGTPEFVLSANTTSLNVVATPVANGKASVTISGQVTGLTPGMTTTITIAVQPEDTSIAPTNYSYGIHILSNDANVDAVYINDNQLTIAPDNTASVIVKALEPPSTFRFTAFESTATSTLKYKMESDGQYVNIVSGATNNNIGITPGGTANHLIITDTAEDGTSKDTTITITSLSTDIRLSEFTATYGGSTNNVTPGQTITLASGVNEVVVAARSTYSGAEVTIGVTGTEDVIGPGYSNKTISVPAGTTKEVLVYVTATDGTTTTNPYKVTFVAPNADPLTTFLTTNNLTLFNNSNSILTNLLNSDQKVAICFTNTTESLKENVTTTANNYTGFNIVLVVTTDNGSSWNIYKLSTNQDNVSMFTSNQYNSMLLNTNTYEKFLDVTKYAEININYNDSSKIVVKLVMMYNQYYLLVDPNNAPNVFYKISRKIDNTSASFLNYSTAAPNFTTITPGNSVSYTNITYLQDVTVGTKVYPLYVASAYEGFQMNKKFVFAFVPVIAGSGGSGGGSDKAMLVHIFANSTNVFYAVDLLSKNEANTNLEFDFKQNVNSDLKTYTSTISLASIETTITSKVTTTTYNVMIVPLSSDTSLSTFTVDGVPVEGESSLEVAAGTTSVNVVATPTSARANAVVTGNTELVEGANTIMVEVTAENGVIAVYTVTLFVAPSPPDTSLSTFTVNGTPVVNGSTVNLPAGTTSVDVVATPTSADAFVDIIDNTGLVVGTNTLEVEVTDNGVSFSYFVTLIVAAPAAAPLSSDTSLFELNFKTGTSNFIRTLSLTNDNQTFPVEFSSSGSLQLFATKSDTNATIDILDNNNNSVSNGTGVSNVVSYSGTTGNIVLKVKVTAQNGTIKTYTITFLVPDNQFNNLALKSFSRLGGGDEGSVFFVSNGTFSSPLSFNRTTTLYDLPGSKQLIIYNGLYDSTDQVKVNNIVNIPPITAVTINSISFSKTYITLNSGNNKIDIRVMNDSGSTYTYTFYVTV